MSDVGAERQVVPAVAAAPLLAIGGAVAALLVTTAGRYGYHRDELYFVEAGRHLAWGYPDQPPYVALVARAMSEVAEGSLVALRTPSALTTGALVVVSGLLARELGGDRRAQVLTAAAVATSGLTFGAGHLHSTTTLSLLVWAAVLLTVLRALRTGRDRLWLLAGVIAGVGLQANSVVAFLLVAIVGGLLLAGPRAPLRTPWPWLGGALALVIWSPYLWWQARHGWPQVEVSAAIAAGDSGTSEPRALFLPFQLGLVNPFLAPVWIIGLLRLFRDPAFAWCRGLAWCWPLLAVVFIASGGKPYYLGGLYPFLLAAGAQPAIDWAAQATRRRVALGGAIVLGLPAFVVTLPVIPVDEVGDTALVDVSYDAGEQIGWPTFAAQVAAVHDDLPAGAAILTRNYGEAGAIDRYGPALGLPDAHSGDMGYWYWGPPPEEADVVIALGFRREDLDVAFADVELAGRIDNGLGVENDEQGAPIWVCRDRRAPWSELWDRFQDP